MQWIFFLVFLFSAEKEAQHMQMGSVLLASMCNSTSLLNCFFQEMSRLGLSLDKKICFKCVYLSPWLCFLPECNASNLLQAV